MQPVVELPPGATDPLLDNKYRSVCERPRQFLSSHTLTRADMHTHTYAHAQMTKGMAPKEVSHGQSFGHRSRTDESCNEVGRTAVERDLRQHSLRRAVVIDPDPGDLSRRRDPHVCRCDREMGAAGRREQQLRGYVDGQTAGQARTNSMEGNEDKKEKKKGRPWFGAGVSA